VVCRSLGRLTGRTTRPDRAIAGPPLSDTSTPSEARSIAAAARRLPSAAGPMRRIPYCREMASVDIQASGSAPNGKTWTGPAEPRITRNGGGRPPFLRIQRNDRLPLSREAIVFFEYDER
jgi:hypothetical protein